MNCQFHAHLCWGDFEYKHWILFIFLPVFFNFLDINFSQEYSVRCACISIKRIHKKVSGRDVRIGIFPIPIASRTGRNSGFSSKIGRIPTRSGWLYSPPACPLFHCLGTQYGGREVMWKRPMHLDTWWHHLATLLDWHTTRWISPHNDDITLYIIYITVCSVSSVSILWRQNLNCRRNFIKWRHHHDVGFKRSNPFF